MAKYNVEEKSTERKALWGKYIPGDELRPERGPNESYKDYRLRRKSNDTIIRILLRRKSSGSNLIPRKQLSPFAAQMQMWNQMQRHEKLRKQVEERMEEEKKKEMQNKVKDKLDTPRSLDSDEAQEL